MPPARRLTLVRHAMPAVDVALPAGAWPLSELGTAAAAALRLDAADETLVVSSPERKAHDTVALALPSAPVTTDERFREVDRVEQVHDDFRAARAAWIAGALDDRHAGWEKPDAAAQRFHDGLLAHAAEHLVVGTHGMVLTAWLVARGLVPDGQGAVEFWDALRLPDVIDLELPLLRVRAVLTDADGRLVLIKRTRPGMAPYWTTPGGGVQLSDTSPTEALRRELREELGAEVSVSDLIHKRALDGIRLEIFYAARLISMNRALRDGPEYADPTRGTYEIERVYPGAVGAIDLRPADLTPVILSRCRD